MPAREWVLSPDLQVVEGHQDVRRGEGLIWTLTVTAYTASDVTAVTLLMSQRSDRSDVTTAWFSDPAGSTFTGGVITIPEFVVPATAALTDYVFTISFEAGDCSPCKPTISITVFE